MDRLKAIDNLEANLDLFQYMTFPNNWTLFDFSRITILDRSKEMKIFGFMIPYILILSEMYMLTMDLSLP